jgi:hypothetical protein
MLVVWPGNFAITEGPATVLCHYHDEKLWNIATMQIKGRLERRADGWVFASSAFTPPSGLLLAFWRLAKSNRAAGQRYLDKRGVKPPRVNWDAIRELRRQAHTRK